eukprot:191310_1
MSTQRSFEHLQSLSKYFIYETPKPLFYPKKSNYIIISTRCTESNAGIYKLNLITNTLELLCQYDNTITFDHHGQFIHNDMLYLFDGSDHFFMYDLKTKSNIKKEFVNTKLGNVFSPETAHISSEEIDQIHVVQHEKHLKYDCKNRALTNMTCPNDDGLYSEYTYPKLIYSKYAKKLIILGSYASDTILTCDINEKIDQNKYEWKVNKIKMPHIVDDIRD